WLFFKDLLPARFRAAFVPDAISLPRNCSSASSLLVQKTRYCSIQADTSVSDCNLTSQNLSLPCCLITSNPHSDRMRICLDMAGRLILKFSATELRFRD